MKKKKIRSDISIDKLVFGGQGLGTGSASAKKLFVWNALPGELVDLEITKRKKSYEEGIATQIHKSSPFRIEPSEEHFLSSNPWDIMQWDYELDWKKNIANDVMQTIGAEPNFQFEHIYTDTVQYGYRNKMEYSFTEEDNEITLAFYKRGHHYKIPIKPSKLAYPHLNDVADNILAWINKNHIPIRSLKSLILRANQQGQVIAGLFIKDEMEFAALPTLDDALIGFKIYYSTHKSPASVPTKLLYQIGEESIDEMVLGTKLAYGLFSFFQVNIPVFEQSLTDMQNFIDSSDVLDFYAGVGAIGLALRSNTHSIKIIESNSEAIAYANTNIMLNDAQNVETYGTASEDMVELIHPDATVIFDPPRAGLHKHVIQKITETKPKTIMYLSCNVSTQARDIAVIKEYYDISFSRLYNFFPRTPHIESLIVLERK